MPSDLHRRLPGEKKKGPGRPPILTSPSTPSTSAQNPSTTSVATSLSNAYSSLGAFANMPGMFPGEPTADILPFFDIEKYLTV